MPLRPRLPLAPKTDIVEADIGSVTGRIVATDTPRR
jgi:hypothetical protein